VERKRRGVKGEKGLKGLGKTALDLLTPEKFPIAAPLIIIYQVTFLQRLSFVQAN